MSAMTPLNRETLGSVLREKLIERYGNGIQKSGTALGRRQTYGALTLASQDLKIDTRNLYRAYSKHGNARESLAVPLRILRRLGYDVRFEVIAKGEAQ